MDLEEHKQLENELKGVYFEYCFSHFLCSKIGTNKPVVSKEHLVRLQAYEESLMTYSPKLLGFLRLAAKESGEFFLSKYRNENFLSAVISGKMLERSHSSELGEGDITLTTKTGNIPISLKFLKSTARPNTKSAGIKSILLKWFPSYDREVTSGEQEKLNMELDFEFRKFCRKLNIIYGLDDTEDFLQWKEKGLPSLPGQLSGEAKKIAHDFYHNMAKALHFSLALLKKKNSSEFKKSLLPLMGFSNENVIQLFYYYHEEKSKISKDRIEINSYQDMLLAIGDNIQISPPSKSTIEISTNEIDLHLRPKPMNSFLVPGLKVNCSLRKRN